MNIDNRVLAVLRVCKNEAEIEDSFKRFHIKNLKDKQIYLLTAMLNNDYSMTDGKTTQKELYKMTTALFFNVRRLSNVLNKLDMLGLVLKTEEETPPLFKQLKACKSKEDIDSVFSHAGIYEASERIESIRN
ncbi:hypothetical protein FUT79_08260 [Treponema phagedenis]|nr:hypothetical protein [Treponema phagedenis]QEJ94655.1 hypothetical protein FUT79_05185 [Treponema phagedenis]QEJ95191.1 hypothetical protein FUT79_08260 [Treponema phagedenis]